MSVAVLIPVLNRPHRVLPLVRSLAEASNGAECIPVFILSPNDPEEEEAVRDVEAWGALRLVVDWEPGPGDYARKHNFAFNALADEFVFLGADDVIIRSGWIEAALAVHRDTGACVVGTNDLANSRVTSGHHSTHTLVHRDYGECGTIDEPDSGKILYEGYDHNFVDDEFVATAKYRQTFAMALGSHVEHQHPNWGTAPDDATYRKGQAKFAQDRALFQSRSHLWSGV